MRPPAVLAIHGGAGPARPDEADGASRWARRSAGLAEALRAGLAVLAGGGAAPQAVVAAVVVLRADAATPAAAPSAGGRTAQLPGRMGDSPVPGAGTWADDATCAVSATGVGEAFLRAAFAHEVDARLRLEGVDLDTACREALAAVTAAGGDGGCVAVSGQGRGRPVMPFTTALMHRGWAEAGGPLFVGAARGPLDRLK